MSTEARLRRVREILGDTGLDAILITNPANRRYLTGFTAEDHAADESSGVVLITRDAATLYVSGTNLPWATAETDTDQVSVEPWNGSISTSVGSHVKEMATRKLAVEDATTPAALWFTLRETLGDDFELIRAGDAIDRLRAIKDNVELDHLREAARLTDLALEFATSRFAIGMTERQGADLVREALREVGSDGEGFDTIVAAGPNAAKPHHRPGDRPMQSGEPIIIDMGASVNGYTGDLTRTICLGEAEERLVAMYNAVLQAQLSALESVRAGVPASAPDLATREVFASQGLERFIIHGVGHGVGLRIHEAPSVNSRAEAPLETGNVVTIEPGLYVAGWGGVRIEDVAIVLHEGHENITSAPKGVDVMQR